MKENRSIKSIVMKVRRMFITERVENTRERSTAGKQFKVLLLRHIKLIVVMFVLLTAFSVGSSIYDYTNKSSALLTYNYDDISNGLNPNKTPFSQNDITCDEVLENAIKLFDKEVPISEVRKCISVRPVDARKYSVSSGNYYMVSTYSLTVNARKSAEVKDAEALLKALLTSYNEFFNKYLTNRSTLDIDYPDLSETEYLDIADMLEKKAGQLQKYVDIRISGNSSYIVDDEMKSFKAISQTLTNFVNYDVASYRSYVTQKGLARDPIHYKSAMQFKNLILLQNYKKELAVYTANIDSIANYNSGLSASVFIPSRDSKNRYYMAKTDTGIDLLASSAKGSIDSANAYLASIRTNNEFIDALSKRHAAGVYDFTKEEYDNAEQLIKNITEELEKISESIKEKDKVYIQYTNRNYIDCVLNEFNLGEALNLKYAIKNDLMLLCLVVIILHISATESNVVKFRKLLDLGR